MGNNEMESKGVILIVDDHLDNLRLLYQCLTEHDYSVRAAKTGIEALSSAQAALPDLVLLDIELPDISGYEVCASLKSDKNTCDIPILFLSAHKETDEILRGFAVGGADYIIKPFKSEEVIARVKTHVEMNKMRSKIEQNAIELRLANEQIQLELAERKRTEAELRKTKENAEIATCAKSQFLANMSHEIRTPMNAVIGSSKILLKMKHTLEQKKYLDIINSAGYNLLSIINDILDISKIEAGKIDIEHKDVALSDIFNNVQNILYPLALSKGIELICERVDEHFPVIKTDSLRLEQILLNIGNNALKFIYQGSVYINVFIKQETNTHVTLCFSVKDTGIGIPQDKINQLFKPFSQISKVKFTGTGLGLIISKKLVELIGGTTIHVETEEGIGSKFWFVIPFEKGSITQLGESNQDTDAGENIQIDLKILVAEDNIFNQEVIKGLLENYQVTVVNNGKEAVKILEKESFDLILMDIQMPEMDGLTASKLIRDRNSMVMNHDIPIIAMTAYAMKEDRNLFLKNGMNGYISKPVNPEILNTEIMRVLKLKDEVKLKHHSAPSTQQVQFNQRIFLESVFNDTSSALKIIQIFIDNIYPECIDKIKNAIENKDGKSLKEASHKFKGSICYFSDAGKKLSFKLQQMGEKQDFLNINEVYEELKKETENLIPQLKDFMRKIA